MKPKASTMIGLKRGIDLLEILAHAGKALTFGELQETYDNLPSPTLSRVLKVLVDQGVVVKVGDQGPYQIGERFVSISKAVAIGITKQELLQPTLNQLAKETDETAAYFEFDGSELELVAKCEVIDSFHMIEIGKKNSRIFRNGFGQLCLAYQSRAFLVKLLKSDCEKPLISDKTFIKRLKEIKQQGFYFENGDTSKKCQRIVAPVFQQDDMLAGAIGISFYGIGDDIDLNHKNAVLKAAKEASEKLSRF